MYSNTIKCTFRRVNLSINVCIPQSQVSLNSVALAILTQAEKKEKKKKKETVHHARAKANVKSSYVSYSVLQLSDRFTVDVRIFTCINRTLESANSSSVQGQIPLLLLSKENT